MDKIFKNAKIFTRGGFMQGCLAESDGIIKKIIPESGERFLLGSAGENIKIIDLHGDYLLPGFIDIHTHGGNGFSFMKIAGQPENMDKMREFYASRGVTSFLMTTLTDSFTETLNVLQRASTYMEDCSGKVNGADMIGINAEGPFLSKEKRGAQNPDFIIDISKDKVDRMLQSSHNLIKMMTIAPEEGKALELIGYLIAKGITVSIGHTNAEYDVIKKAAELGACHMTHFYNGMSPLHHRYPGAVGAGYLIDDMTLEIICDGLHVHPDLVDFLFKVKPTGKICFITDSVLPAGCPDGYYVSGGMDVEKKNGRITLKGKDNLAGSCLTMIDAFQNACKFVKQDLETIIPAFTQNPAREAHADDRKGTLMPGKDADFIVLNQNFDLEATYVRGINVFQT